MLLTRGKRYAASLELPQSRPSAWARFGHAGMREWPQRLARAAASRADCPNGPHRPRRVVRSSRLGRARSDAVFLAGLGNTAHVFDDFAPQFTDSFHVVGITRRGFGASASSPPPSDLDTLVADITAVLDTLGLRQVILVGHSIAGEEMTRFAEIHGTRCAGLIYLDAAYDRSGIDTLAQHQPSAPSRRFARRTLFRWPASAPFTRA